MKNHAVTRALLIGALVIVGAVGCAETAADQAGVHYDGGPFEGAKYNEIIKPGSGQVFVGPDDDVYLYPTTTRDYTASDNSADGPESGAITCPVEGSDTKWTVVAYFRINTQKLKGFHENVGMKYKAHDAHTEEAKGWTEMLRKQFEPHLVNAVQRVCRGQKLDELQKSADVFGKLNEQIAGGLKEQINEGMSGEYLCGPSYSGPVEENGSGAACPPIQVAVKRVDITNDQVRASYDAQKAAANREQTAQAEGRAKLAEANAAGQADQARAQAQADAAAKLNALYTNPAYIEYLKAQAQLECAKNPQCVQVNDATGGATVNVGR